MSAETPGLADGAKEGRAMRRERHRGVARRPCAGEAGIVRENDFGEGRDVPIGRIDNALAPGTAAGARSENIGE